MNAKDSSRSLYATLAICALGVVCVGCSGGSGGSAIIGPSPTDLSGDYTVTANVTTDTCGMSSLATMSGQVRLSPSGNGLELTQASAAGPCDTYASQQHGNTVTQTRTDILTSGACTVSVETTATLTFTGAHFDSVESHHYAYDSGDCGEFTACDWVVEGQGDRCTGCWLGCQGTLGFGGTTLPRTLVAEIPDTE